MFELNLIKDKAEARMRRRIIFLAITCIIFVAALSSLFIFSLFIKEWNDTLNMERQAKAKETEVNGLKTDLDKREPEVIKRRNAMITAWKQDMDILRERIVVTPALKQLSDIRSRPPTNMQFWYSNLVIVPQRAPTQNTNDPNRFEPLQPPMILVATGVVQIPESDDKTKLALDTLQGDLGKAAFIASVGEPLFTINLQSGLKAPGGGNAARYAEFLLATQRTSTSGAVRN